MQITLAQAAQRLGVANSTLRAMINAGRLQQVAGTIPAEVRAEDVDRIRVQRRNEALRRHPDLAGFAREVRRTLWPMSEQPPDTVELYDGRVQARHTVPASVGRPASGRDAMINLPIDAAALFGPDVLETAAAPASAFAHACRWCFADAAARVHETFRPQNTTAYRVLLGEPCARDRERFAAEATAARSELAALKARVDRQTAQRAKETARTAFATARAAAQTAQKRFEAASQALVTADPAAASVVASGAVRAKASRIDCACTSETLCADHAQRLTRRGRR